MDNQDIMLEYVRKARYGDENAKEILFRKNSSTNL